MHDRVMKDGGGDGRYGIRQVGLEVICRRRKRKENVVLRPKQR